MAACKRLETISALKFAAKSVTNEKRCLKVMLRPALTGQVLIFDSKKILATCLCKYSSTVLLTNPLLLDREDLS